jgi:hypothetical protein
MTHQQALNIAARAWSRTKPASDPDFAKCLPTFQSDLAYRVEHIAKGAAPSDAFERAVQEILNAPRASKTLPRDAAFAVLHLRDDAPPEVVRAAYKALALTHHPDRGGSAEKMKSLNEAYRKLTT